MPIEAVLMHIAPIVRVDEVLSVNCLYVCMEGRDEVDILKYIVITQSQCKHIKWCSCKLTYGSYMLCFYLRSSDRIGGLPR